ncbi:hypothetical protein UMM65_14810 [Aureibaculum sp. 2210JD6-5]|uniref:hypothetical protein n=1 Tax=Aureibaculum sp. 2210JD6-5 TaxID=3103957 RepID=UPI002AACE8C3|nr:hypothetical protein [Aureibaculum sp. 2210JD6-5]MDY7396520.1 hypothetical protein [Aureibaculum sp. 2210JD6-5]
MAPNKFEQHIKEELNKREIQPKVSSWDKISQKLDKPQKQRKPKYLWWGIAASFAGLIIISTIYFNAKKSNMDGNSTIVDTDKDSIEIKSDIYDKAIESSEENQIADTPIDKQNNIKELLDKNTKIKSERPNGNPQKNAITEVAIVNPQMGVVTNNDISNQEELIQQKIAEVVAKVENLEQNHKTLTDLEVDSLILQAQKEILQNKLFRQNQTVDAMALLNEVEDELDKPLKDQLFDLLKKGIFESRNAIAARNN